MSNFEAWPTFIFIPFYTEVEYFLMPHSKWALDLICRQKKLKMFTDWKHFTVRFKVSDCKMLPICKICKIRALLPTRTFHYMQFRKVFHPFLQKSLSKPGPRGKYVKRALRWQMIWRSQCGLLLSNGFAEMDPASY